MIDDFDIASSPWTSFAESAALHGLGGFRAFPLKLALTPLGSLVVFTADLWNSRELSNAYGQSMADAAAVTTQHILLSRNMIELAVGMIAELDGLDIYAATEALSVAAKARGISLAQYAQKVVNEPGLR
ncbi:hypothetical protein [Rhodococcus sp. IEGM 1379]|uniref:hypothetical protein n=1 Tax=Rhodococcus sp. IEGM 1379 TaxID=3047086 RepID=UPI0024B8404B|nr:hypothetical protein [Rhodococcus sp. IEGM 1379]MDI9915062.1 hypothetical protein [Rhodococcus sp. IEGM 1379]